MTDKQRVVEAVQGLPEEGSIVGIGAGTLRDRIKDALSNALQPLPHVLAGWESGSVAFNLVDAYSDVDLNFLVDDASPVDPLYAVVESALETLSPISARHSEPPGRYFKLVEGGDFLLVDVCMFRTGDLGERLDVDRHGKMRPLFDKGDWLRSDNPAGDSQAASRARRRDDLEAWFSVSQAFVHKALLRGQDAEALAAFWGYTLKPLVELLRMRYCPARWDFGMRYLQRDLPGPVYEKLRGILFVGEPDDLAGHLVKATEWAETLLRELATQGKHRLSLVPIGRDGTPHGYAGSLPEATTGVFRAAAELYRTVGFEEPWVCYLALAGGTPVGTCGFKSPPRAGRVEIAYFTFPQFEGRGLASAMATSLVAMARRHGLPVLVAAQTLPERNASHRILEKLGFRHVTTIDHPEDGTVWEWQLREETGT